jgi:hypothetical protein
MNCEGKPIIEGSPLKMSASSGRKLTTKNIPVYLDGDVKKPEFK